MPPLSTVRNSIKSAKIDFDPNSSDPFKTEISCRNFLAESHAQSVALKNPALWGLDVALSRPLPQTTPVMAFQITRGHSRFFASGRQQLVYIPWKTKEEIIGLHDDDATRWNASTLSARFNAPRENVEAILRLGGIRKQREKMIQSLNKEHRERIVKAREKAINAWTQLSESVPTGTKRGPARPSELQRPAAAVDTGGRDEAGEADEADKEEESDAEIELENSPWAEYVEKEGANFETDIPRRSTYAFIEIGDQKEDLRRAVWLREPSGKVRQADEDERKLLLNEERVRDSPAWKQ